MYDNCKLFSNVTGIHPSASVVDVVVMEDQTDLLQLQMQMAQLLSNIVLMAD
jgi:hypothetical protein